MIVMGVVEDEIKNYAYGPCETNTKTFPYSLFFSLSLIFLVLGFCFLYMNWCKSTFGKLRQKYNSFTQS